ncbi:N-formylglutamate amidohydrolase [uncultured Christiangramia sp.]|uniref:N-formylglutamate amidohydrolase n=1 Tax=uncultured Christiangramia sp. TaxID=503836 RepID=UPI00260FB1A5|nr:N-formylglutamate amidohydrolase [uncultured Christiangramia sp.]
MKIVITCEHATNAIPPEYVYLFEEQKDVLNTHEGYDPGAYDLYKYLEPLSNASYAQDIGRLLIETNRSLHHPKLYSRFSKILEHSKKSEIIEKHYSPYRRHVENLILDFHKLNHTILHLSIHSFTPVLDDIERNCDIGILYDPKVRLEQEWSEQFKRSLTDKSKYRVRKNYPYYGKADGFTTYLRKVFTENYIGIEIEVNQKFVFKNKMNVSLKETIYNSVKDCIKKAP